MDFQLGWDFAHIILSGDTINDTVLFDLTTLERKEKRKCYQEGDRVFRDWLLRTTPDVELRTNLPPLVKSPNFFLYVHSNNQTKKVYVGSHLKLTFLHYVGHLKRQHRGDEPVSNSLEHVAERFLEDTFLTYIRSLEYYNATVDLVYGPAPVLEESPSSASSSSSSTPPDARKRGFPESSNDDPKPATKWVKTAHPHVRAKSKKVPAVRTTGSLEAVLELAASLDSGKAVEECTKGDVVSEADLEEEEEVARLLDPQNQED